MADFPASHVWLPEGSFQDIARIIQESIQGLELQPSWLWRREACRLWFYMIFLLSYVIPCDSPPSMDWFVGQTLQENPMIFVGKLMVSCKFAPTNQCIDFWYQNTSPFKAYKGPTSRCSVMLRRFQPRRLGVRLFLLSPWWPWGTTFWGTGPKNREEHYRNDGEIMDVDR